VRLRKDKELRWFEEYVDQCGSGGENGITTIAASIFIFLFALEKYSLGSRTSLGVHPPLHRELCGPSSRRPC